MKVFLGIILTLFFSVFQISSDCPPGTVPVWAIDPVTRQATLLCLTCTTGGNQTQNIQIGLKSDTHSGSHSGNTGNKQTSYLPNFSAPHFSGSWSDLLFCKQAFFCYIIGGATCYAIIYYYLKQGDHLLFDEDAWCNWHYGANLDPADQTKKKALSDELFATIQTKYVNTKNPTDHVSPLNQFLEEYRKELLVLQRYFTLIKWIGRFKLTKLFPVKQEHVFALKERVERLAKVKELFFDWTTEYKKTRCSGSVSTAG